MSTPPSAPSPVGSTQKSAQTEETSRTQNLGSGEEGSEGAKGKSSLLPSLLKGVVERGVDVLGSTLGQELRRELEARGLNTELIKKTLEQGVNKGAEVLDQTEGLRRSIPIHPSELVERVAHKVDSYKAEGVEIARSELRRFLDRIDLNQELQALLSQFSVEVKTEIRFAPSDDGSGVKPIVKTSAQVKRDPEAKRAKG